MFGSPFYCLSKKLKHTKKALKYWNKHFFENIRTKLNSTLQLLDVTQQAPPSDSNLALELHLKSVINELLQHEESMWKNKSRELLLTCKDLNTRFFHTSTLIRRKRNTIDRLFSPNIGWISDRTAIGRCLVTHFKDLFKTTNVSPPFELLDLFQPSISDDDNSLLCAIPTESEIYTALSSLGRLKASGPDGFTALFYLKYWDIIKYIVLPAVWNFFNHNQLLREQNHTFLALIPKKMGAFTIQHFRLIAFAISSTRLSPSYLPTGSSLFSLTLFLLCRLFLFLIDLFRITPFWHMKCCIPLNLREEEVGSWQLI
jgi:hypothetical protein